MQRPPPPSGPPPSDPIPSVPEPAAGAPGRRFAPDESRCELCGFTLFVERHCKVICPNCGYTRDCSDP